MLAISLALALICIVGGYVWGWVELGRAWNRQNLRVEALNAHPRALLFPPSPLPLLWMMVILCRGGWMCFQPCGRMKVFGGIVEIGDEICSD